MPSTAAHRRAQHEGRCSMRRAIRPMTSRRNQPRPRSRCQARARGLAHPCRPRSVQRVVVTAALRAQTLQLFKRSKRACADSRSGTGQLVLTLLVERVPLHDRAAACARRRVGLVGLHAGVSCTARKLPAIEDAKARGDDLLNHCCRTAAREAMRRAGQGCRRAAWRATPLNGDCRRPRAGQPRPVFAAGRSQCTHNRLTGNGARFADLRSHQPAAMKNRPRPGQDLASSDVPLGFQKSWMTSSARAQTAFSPTAGTHICLGTALMSM